MKCFFYKGFGMQIGTIIKIEVSLARVIKKFTIMSYSSHPVTIIKNKSLNG